MPHGGSNQQSHSDDSLKSAGLSKESLNRRIDQTLNSAEFSEIPVERQDILQQLLPKLDRLTSDLSAEIGEFESARSTLRRNYFSYTRAVLVVAFGTGALYASYTYRLSGSISWLPLAAIACTTLWLAAMQILITRLRKARIQKAEREIELRLDVEIPALLREIVNEREKDPKTWSNSFQTQTGPALVDLEIRDIIASTTSKRLKSFIVEHKTSVIGIAGPRGIGKSTLMERLRHNEGISRYNVQISAPTSYQPTEFVRLIHERLAKVILRQTGDPPPSNEYLNPGLSSARFPVIALGAVVLIVGIAATLWTFFLDLLNKEATPLEVDRVGPISLVVTFAFGASAAVVIYMGSRMIRRTSILRRQPTTIRSLARKQLQLLHWTTAVQQSSKATLSLKSLAFEGSDQVTRTQRELTHAEHVENLRDFFAEICRMTKSSEKILICIDELDKVADPKTAIELVNNIKDLFHVPGVHFLISVSTDALRQFAARGVPRRDVFDSSFDTIAEVPKLSFSESRQLLSRRTTGFPASAVMFCHAWSGGHPRDLIRTARSCVEARSIEGRDLALSELARIVVSRDLSELIDAWASNSQESADADFDPSKLLNLRDRLLADDGTRSRALEMLRWEPVPPENPNGSDGESALVNAFGSYMQVADAVVKHFALSRDPDGWRSEVAKVEAIARARAALGLHRSEVRRLLHQIPAFV